LVEAPHKALDHGVVYAGLRGQALGKGGAARPVRNFKRHVVHACVPSRDADLRSTSCSFEAGKQDIVFEMDMLREVGCELVEARTEGTPGIAVILRRLEAVRHSFDGAHLCAMLVVFMAHTVIGPKSEPANPSR